MMKRSKAYLGIALTSVLLLSACAQPSKIYAADKSSGTYFSVPRGWKMVSQEDLSAHEATSTVAGASDRLASVIWQEGYSPDTSVTAKKILSLKTSDQPIVYARVRDLNGDEINAISYNGLRNIIVPLTSWFDGVGSVPDFTISVDEERIEKGARGVHSIFTFQGADGAYQTINQIALLSNDHTRIFVLIVRCSKKCYSENRQVLEDISNSYTVRGSQ
ncbi:MAG: hypothetical protein RL414_496 [Actinomycetota bacterium]|jgi:hypothetical protein